MARRSICALVLLSLSIPALASAHVPTPVPAITTDLAITMINECSAGDTLLETAAREAARVWSSADVNLQWVSISELPYRASRSTWLVVRCIAGQASPSTSKSDRALAIASIRFIASRPTNTIVVSLGSATTLMNRDFPESRELIERFQLLKENRLGRMIGRAIAHEIGHFLSRSETHAPNGLMKASHSLGAFVGESLDPFRIDRAALVESIARTAAPLVR